MRRLLISLFLCSSALCISTLAWAQAYPYSQIQLDVGGSYEVPSEGMQCVCDDRTVVAVRWVGANLQLTGLRPGRTLCGLMHNGFLTNVVYDVAVE